MKTLLLNGSSGFLGHQIIQFLKGKYNIITLKRNDYLLPPDLLAKKIEGCDYIINLAGASIAQLWTTKTKNDIYNSRIQITRNLVYSFAYLNKKPSLFISASGINVYNNNLKHTEDSVSFDHSFLGTVCADWEREASKAQQYNIPVTLIRTGVVLSPSGGFLRQVNRTVPFKFLVKFGKGNNSLPFIHLDDYLNALLFIMQGNYSGIFNFVAPNSVKFSEFYRVYLNKSKCWAIIQIPEFLLKLLPGKQSDVFLKSPDVMPRNLLLKGYSFLYPTIEKTINTINLRN
jgi:uncharacterized protein